MLNKILFIGIIVVATQCWFMNAQGIVPASPKNDPTNPSGGIGGGAGSGDAGGDSKPMSTGQCSFQTPQGLHYDFSHLRKSGGEDYTKIIQVGPNIQFIYRMNLCANTLVNCQNEPAPATEALKIPAGETCRVLGRLAGAKWKVTDAGKSDKNPWGKNLELTYLNGDMCDPAKATSRSVTLKLECDLTAKDPSKFFTEVKKEATCNTQYVFQSAEVCPSTGKSQIMKLLTFLLTIFTLYCILGVAIQKFYMNKPWGIELIPNYNFWMDFPNLVQDGFSFTMEKIKQVQENGVGSLLSGSGGGSGGGDFGAGNSSSGKRGARYGKATGSRNSGI